ncbi:alpha-hydroxy acid oxidase [Bosea sp. NPDC055594]
MPSRILNTDEMRLAAQRVLPRGMFEFIDRGTEGELALPAARAALDAVKFSPNVLVDVSRRDQSVELFGSRLPLPIIAAPTGLAGLMWYRGEIELARAAARAGIPFCVSTQSITSIGDIAAGAGGNLWFQLYILNDRAITETFVDAARAAGSDTLILTVDTSVSPKREYNTHNGFGIPMAANWRAALDFAMHPRWCLNVMGRYLAGLGMPSYAHYPDAFRRKITRAPLGDALRLADDVTWTEIAALRRRWPGRFIIKGILRCDDAQRALDCGADGIVVSNHGGRNLDSAIAPARALPEIAERLGDRLVILADGSVRRGSDVVKLLALGARAVLVGRSLLYGVAMGGCDGAGRVIEILRDEVDRTMAFMGCSSLAALDGDALARES